MKNTVGCIYFSECCYAQAYGCESKCETYLPITNAYRIRRMSDEELALLLSAGFSCESICSECDPMGKYLGAACDNDCAKHYLDWLRQPAETEGTE